MRKAFIALLLVACRSESTTTFRASTTLDGLDRQMILGKLQGSTTPVSELPDECVRIYEGVETLSSLGSVVRDQHRRAESWEASCRRDQAGLSCIVKLVNSKDDDAEFMAEYRFALDAQQVLIESTLTCVLAG